MPFIIGRPTALEVQEGEVDNGYEYITEPETGETVTWETAEECIAFLIQSGMGITTQQAHGIVIHEVKPKEETTSDD
jgi:hypothetical protein